MTRQQIKEMAKAQLGGKIFGNKWLIAVVVIVIQIFFATLTELHILLETMRAFL